MSDTSAKAKIITEEMFAAYYKALMTFQYSEEQLLALFPEAAREDLGWNSGRRHPSSVIQSTSPPPSSPNTTSMSNTWTSTADRAPKASDSSISTTTTTSTVKRSFPIKPFSDSLESETMIFYTLDEFDIEDHIIRPQESKTEDNYIDWKVNELFPLEGMRTQPTSPTHSSVGSSAMDEHSLAAQTMLSLAVKTPLGPIHLGDDLLSPHLYAHGSSTCESVSDMQTNISTITTASPADKATTASPADNTTLQTALTLTNDPATSSKNKKRHKQEPGNEKTRKTKVSRPNKKSQLSGVEQPLSKQPGAKEIVLRFQSLAK